MDYAPETLIERLKEQIELAPRLEPSDVDGGSPDSILGRLKELLNLAGEMSVLKGVESGARRFKKCIAAAIDHVEALVKVFDGLATVHGAGYPDSETKQKAMARHKDKTDSIVKCCRDAIKAMEDAMLIVYEGENRHVTQHNPAAAGAAK